MKKRYETLAWLVAVAVVVALRFWYIEARISECEARGLKLAAVWGRGHVCVKVQP